MLKEKNPLIVARIVNVSLMHRNWMNTIMKLMWMWTQKKSTGFSYDSASVKEPVFFAYICSFIIQSNRKKKWLHNFCFDHLPSSNVIFRLHSSFQLMRIMNLLWIYDSIYTYIYIYIKVYVSVDKAIFDLIIFLELSRVPVSLLATSDNTTIASELVLDDGYARKQGKYISIHYAWHTY